MACDPDKEARSSRILGRLKRILEGHLDGHSGPQKCVWGHEHGRSLLPPGALEDAGMMFTVDRVGRMLLTVLIVDRLRDTPG